MKNTKIFVDFIKFAKNKDLNKIENLIQNDCLNKNIIYPSAFFPKGEVGRDINNFYFNFCVSSFSNNKGIGDFSPDLFLVFFGQGHLVKKRHKNKDYNDNEEIKKTNQKIIHYLSFYKDDSELFEYYFNEYKKNGNEFIYVFSDYLKISLKQKFSIPYPKKIFNKIISYTENVSLGFDIIEQDFYKKSYDKIKFLATNKELLLTIIKNKDFQLLTNLNNIFDNFIKSIPEKYKHDEIKSLNQTEVVYSCFEDLIFNENLEVIECFKDWCDKNINLSKPLLLHCFEKIDNILNNKTFMRLINNKNNKNEIRNYIHKKSIKVNGIADKVIFLSENGFDIDKLNVELTLKKYFFSDNFDFSSLDMEEEHYFKIYFNFLKIVVQHFPDIIIKIDQKIKLNSKLKNIYNNKNIYMDFSDLEYSIKLIEQEKLKKSIDLKNKNQKNKRVL